MGRIAKMRLVGLLAGVTSVVSLVGCQQEPATDTPGAPPGQAASPSEPSHVVRGAVEFVLGYAKGYDLAKKTDRPMLLFFTADWCHYCHQMEQDAFVDAAVSNLAKRFVCVLVDADRESRVCQEFDVRGYPTIQFMTSNGVPLNRLTGQRPADQLVPEMEAALEAAALRAQRTGQPLVR